VIAVLRERRGGRADSHLLATVVLCTGPRNGRGAR
jgi:hypothetical protein